MEKKMLISIFEPLTGCLEVLQEIHPYSSKGS